MQTHGHEIYFSRLQGRKIFDSTGKQAGKVKDVVVQWDGGLPRVTGIRFSADFHKLIPAAAVWRWEETGVRLRLAIDETPIVDIRGEELYVGKWLLDKQIIDLKGSKLVRVNDILLCGSVQDGDQQLSLVAADVGIRGLLRRIGLEFLAGHCDHRYISWQSITPLETKTGNLKLNRNRIAMRKLHPADIANLVQEMDYNSRAAFFRSLDEQQAVEALAEMELNTQVELISQLGGSEASDLLAEMPPDEAADILGGMPERQSSELLQLMEPGEADEVRSLMRYEEDTAGGLMTTEYISLPVSLTVQQAIERLRELAPAAETIYYLYVLGDESALKGVLSLRELIVAKPEETLKSLMHSQVVTVHCQDSHRKVAEVICKYGLLAVPVTDGQGRMLGIITFDDVLDLLMPDRPMPDLLMMHLRSMRRR